MADVAKTSINPSDQESTPSAMAKIFRDFMLNVDDLCPAIVISYDRNSNEAVVRPIIQRLTVSDEAVSRKEVVSVQVFSFGAGGVHINFHLVPGDLGWIKAADRDTANFRAELKEAPPPNSTTHSYAGSMFYPDVMRQYTIQGEHSQEAVFQTTDGVNRIAVGASRIKVATGSTYIELTDGKVKINTDLLEVVSPETTFSGDVTIQGRTTMNSGFESSGGGTSSVDNLTVAGTPVEDHDHSDPQGGRTGPFGG